MGERHIVQENRQTGAFDSAVILVGGGLANSLIALRLAQHRPDLRIIMVEAAAEICGNNTWSFHATDIDADDYAFLRPVIRTQWPGQQVFFPQLERRLTTGYASITSETLRAAVVDCAAIEILTGEPVEKLGRNRVVLAGGRELSAPCIIDGRGYQPDPALRIGYQKFVGLELDLQEPHGETVPTIMDARVAQLDGYRFFYVLPLTPTCLLLEDTRYSDTPHLDVSELRPEVLNYAKQRGWPVREEVRLEKGVLPITLAHDFDAFWQADTAGPARVGMRAGLFQPTTGYSLPEAVRVARMIATECEPLDTATVDAKVRAYARKKARGQSFMRFLNRMLFLGAEPRERYTILQRFYTLPQGLIERFYAGQLKPVDKVRILSGKPPIPIRNALRCVSESNVLAVT